MKWLMEHHDRFAVIHLQGKIEIGNGDVHLRECLREAAKLGHSYLILDLEKVTRVDSAGIGELVSQYRVLRDEGIQLCLTKLNAKIYHLLALTRLVTVFAIYDSNEDAIQCMPLAA